jgi:hypothetical protein
MTHRASPDLLQKESLRFEAGQPHPPPLFKPGHSGIRGGRGYKAPWTSAWSTGHCHLAGTPFGDLRSKQGTSTMSGLCARRSLKTKYLRDTQPLSKHSSEVKRKKNPHEEESTRVSSTPHMACLSCCVVFLNTPQSQGICSQTPGGCQNLWIILVLAFHHCDKMPEKINL